MEFRRVAIVMAGGTGERFWPLSRADRPKQLLTLTPEGGTMMEQAIARLIGVFEPEDIFVVTATNLIDSVRAVIPNIPSDNIFAEPLRRNTSGCLIYAAALLKAKYGSEQISMAVVTADHLITPTVNFQTDLRHCLDISEREGAIVTIGVPPTRPETGYGYIESGTTSPVDSPGKAFAVNRFHEKPNQAMAEEYVQKPEFLWNSGMFFWTFETFSKEIHGTSPIHGGVLDLLIPLIKDDMSSEIDRTFADLPNLSIDYALLEKSNRIVVLRATFDWDDLGSWDAIGRYVQADERGNAIKGDGVVVESDDCLIYNVSSEITVAISGVKDLLVVVTDDAVLVCERTQAQSVRGIVEQLKNQGSTRI